MANDCLVVTLPRAITNAKPDMPKFGEIIWKMTNLTTPKCVRVSSLLNSNASLSFYITGSDTAYFCNANGSTNLGRSVTTTSSLDQSIYCVDSTPNTTFYVHLRNKYLIEFILSNNDFNHTEYLFDLYQVKSSNFTIFNFGTMRLYGSMNFSSLPNLNTVVFSVIGNNNYDCFENVDIDNGNYFELFPHVTNFSCYNRYLPLTFNFNNINGAANYTNFQVDPYAGVANAQNVTLKYRIIGNIENFINSNPNCSFIIYGSDNNNSESIFNFSNLTTNITKAFNIYGLRKTGNVAAHLGNFDNSVNSIALGPAITDDELLSWPSTTSFNVNNRLIPINEIRLTNIDAKNAVINLSNCNFTKTFNLSGPLYNNGIIIKTSGGFIADNDFNTAVNKLKSMANYRVSINGTIY